MSKTPFRRKDDNEFLGFIVKDITGWQAQTIFGYMIERTETEKDARAILNDKGPAFLTGVWQYFDKDENAWFPCIVKEASEHKVTVIRTDVMGYQNPNNFKFVVITDPTEHTLSKSAL